jgi:hypothetical protein
MTRKQFLILILALLVLGGVGLALFWKDYSSYRDSGARIGAMLLPDLRIADVAEIRLQDAKHRATLARKDNQWVVEERGGYPADFDAISALMLKLIELKVTQSEQVAARLYPRLELGEPGKGEGAGTAMEFRDAAGKTLAHMILGKTLCAAARGERPRGRGLGPAQCRAGRPRQVAQAGLLQGRAYSHPRGRTRRRRAAVDDYPQRGVGRVAFRERRQA